MTSMPRGVCTTSGWNWTANRPCVRILHRRDGTRRRRRDDVEPRRRLHDGVAVRHPRRRRIGQSVEERIESRSTSQLDLAVLTDLGVSDVAAERLRHDLLSVTDAEHGDAEPEDRARRSRARRARTPTPGPRTGSARPACGAGSRRRESSAGRSPSTRGTRGRDARSAGRTAHRSRGRGPGRASSRRHGSDRPHAL